MIARRKFETFLGKQFHDTPSVMTLLVTVQVRHVSVHGVMIETEGPLS
jgi:hypothetical protein